MINLDSLLNKPLEPKEIMYLNYPQALRAFLYYGLISRKNLSIEKVLPYIYQANSILNNLNQEFDNARRLEANGDLEGALLMYKTLSFEWLPEKHIFYFLYNTYLSASNHADLQNLYKNYLEMLNVLPHLTSIDWSEVLEICRLNKH